MCMVGLPSGHPTMNLVGEGLYVVGRLEVLFEPFDSFLVFVAGCEHAERDVNPLRVVWIYHCWMNLGSSAERCARLAS